MLLNGIDDVATRPDLAERSIVVHLPAIAAEKRRTEEEIWRHFYELAPSILGGFLSAASAALRNLHATKLPQQPRMADFARFVVAGESMLGSTPGAFLSAYLDAQRASHAVGLEGYPAIDLLVRAAAGMFDRKLEEPATALLERANAAAEASAAILRHPAWPKGAQQLANQLKRTAPMLRARGIEVRLHRTATARVWTISVPEAGLARSSQPSRPSYQTPLTSSCDDDDDADDLQRAWEAK